MVTKSNITIKGINNIVEIVDYSMKNRMSIHPIAEISFITNNQNIWQAFLDRDRVYEIEDKSTRYHLFRGYIENVNSEKYGSEWKVCVKLSGVSSILDRETKDRSFQEVSNNNATIINDILHMETDFSMVSKVLNDSEIGKPLIQYEETNWAFMKRVASRIAAPIFVRESEATDVLYLGIDTQAAPIQNLKGMVYSEGIDARKFNMKSVPESKGYNQGDYYYYSYETEQDMQLGEKVIFNGYPMYIYEKKASVVKEVLTYCYKFVFKPYCEVPVEYNPRFSGATVLGTICETKAETLKLKLKLKDEGKSGLYAYDWKPEAGNMMYCMPQNDTTVSLYFPDDDEQNAYAINCIRRVPAPGVVLDPRTKSFITEDKKILLMAENAFHLFSMQDDDLKANLSLVDSIGVQADTSKKILIEGEGVCFDAPDISFIAEKEVQILSGKGRNNNPKDECKIYISSNYIDYYGNSGGVNFIVRKHNNKDGYELILDEPTEIIEKDFDWGGLIAGIAVGIAIVAAVTVLCLCPIALGLVAAGTTAASVCTGAAVGAAVTGSFAVGMRAFEDQKNGEVSPISDYAITAFVKSVTGAIEGAITAPFSGVMAAEGEIAKFSWGAFGKKIIADQVGNAVQCVGDYIVDACESDHDIKMTWGDVGASAATTFVFSGIDFGFQFGKAKKAEKALKNATAEADVAEKVYKEAEEVVKSAEKNGVKKTEKELGEKATKRIEQISNDLTRKNKLLDWLERYTSKHPNADDFANRLVQLEKLKGTIENLEERLAKYNKYVDSKAVYAGKKAALDVANSKLDDAITMWTKKERKDLLISLGKFFKNYKSNIPKVFDNALKLVENKDARNQAIKEVNKALNDKEYDTAMKIAYNVTNETISKQTVKPWIDNKVEKNKDK